jgi:prephenate dehydrogenase
VNTAAARIDKLVVVGVGLIGGSFALALRAAGQVGCVVGVGRGQVNLDEAKNLGIIDRGHRLTGAWTRELGDADLVMLATPVAQLAPLLRTMAPHLGAHSIVTDAGSTKQDVVLAARATLGDALSRFVPAHPIAGTERSGAAAAFATLYAGRNVVLTPLAETDPLAAATVASAWAACGARIHVLAPEAHDRIFAAVSHLPHVLAFALVHEFARRDEAEDLFRFAGGGFRDFTRIAASSPEMWRDIALANRVALLAELTTYRNELDRVAALLAAADGAGLEATFADARDVRRAWEARVDSPAGPAPASGGGVDDA